MHAALLPGLAFAPWRLSGTVVGAALNDPAHLAALGDQVHAAPYKAAPKAPVLYFKPRHTLAPPGATTRLPPGEGALCVGATLGIVIARSACRVAAADALQHIAGYALVADLFVPHASQYRPHARHKVLDASCLVGPPRSAKECGDPDALTMEVQVGEGAPVRLSTAGMVRPVAALVQDVSEFMTLQPGDLLLLGVRHLAPLAGAGQHYRITSPGLGELRGEVQA